MPQIMTTTYLYSLLSSSQSMLFKCKRLLLPAIILVGLLSSHNDIFISVLADAFIQVTVFVALTLFIYYQVARYFPCLELSFVRKNVPRLEIPLASLLGALPGCGGAIIVVTQFTKGQVSFGSVVAVLTATMGDAAFLLLAKRPLDGLLVLSVGFAMGCLSGWLIDRFSHHRFDVTSTPLKSSETVQSNQLKQFFKFNYHASHYFWRVVAIPAVLLAFAVAFQVDFEQISPTANSVLTSVFAFCGFVVVLFWSFASKGESYQDVTAEDDANSSISRKIIQDTHFVTAWVVSAFLCYELAVTLFELNLGVLFNHYAVLAPLAGTLIGLLPGCGPQILVTSLYIQGVIPFSAVLGNALSNDGDALFPAIALAPKAALLASLYSAIPAVVVAYTVYFLF